MQQRYYDPVIGRFYSNDPVDMLGHMQKGNPTMGFNRYAYANNNPYKYTDPDGRYMIPVSVGSPGNVSMKPMAPQGYRSHSSFEKSAVAAAAGDLSSTLTVGAIGAAAFGQLEVAGPLAAGAMASGYVEAALSEEPAKALLVETVANVTGAKYVGTVAKVASNLAGESKRAQAAIAAANEAGQDAVSNMVKEADENMVKGDEKEK